LFRSTGRLWEHLRCRHSIVPDPAFLDGIADGGQETISTPPAIQGNRTVQLDKDGRATGILSFYLKTPARSNVRVSFDFGPWARYGFVKEVFVRDVNGNVSGGKVEQMTRTSASANPIACTWKS
jgi:hypothetical protein